jgi:hypothetical protein
VLDAIEARAFRKHPPGENTFLLAIELHFIDFDECRGLGLLGCGPRITNARRHL